MLEMLESRLLMSTTWFVSASGSNSNPGTIAQPLQTIQAAAAAAQPGDTVYIRGGTYHETITPANSGTASSPIIYSAYNGEKVTIEGADPISQWTPVAGSKNIYQASMPWTLGEGNDQVFVNGQAMNEAAWPNTAIGAVQPATATIKSVYNTQDGTVGGNAAVATISVANLPGGPGAWDGATIHIGCGQSWVIQTGTVLNSGNGTLTFAYQHDGSYEVPTAGNKFYLTGKYVGLDAAGEWYRDSSGHLYLWAPGGGSPTAVEAKSRQFAFDLSGRSYIDISNVQLLACAINTNAASDHIIISNITANYISQQMINPIGWNTDSTSTGILFLGTNSILQNSTINHSSGNGAFLGGSNNIVQNCEIANTDYSGTDEAGITIAGTANQALSNFVHDTGRDGIIDSNAIKARIIYNRITAIGHQDTDLGAIYDYGTDSQGTLIANNTIYNIHTGGYGGDGIYLDNGSANYLVQNNTITNVQYPLHLNKPSYSNVVVNTTIDGKRVATSSSGGGSPAAAAVVYFGLTATLTTLGNLGGFRSTGSGINNSGQVAGDSLAGASRPGFLYSNNSMTTILANSLSHGVQVNGLNDSGQVVGQRFTGSNYIGFKYAGGTVTNIAPLPGDVSSAANAINASGQIAGVSYSAGAVGHAFIYSNGIVTSLGTLGGRMSEAFAIDDAGTAVGQSTLAGDRDAHAFISYGGSVHDLGTLGGSSSCALAINNSYEIAGESLIAGNKAFHAFLYVSRQMKDLGTLPGFTNSVATGLDTAGDVVGYCYNNLLSNRHAFLYRNGKMIDLNNLLPANTGWTLTAANAINDHNQITGYADAADQRRQAFVLLIVG